MAIPILPIFLLAGLGRAEAKEPVFETVVSATRSEVQTFSAPRAIDTVTAEALAERQARTFPEAVDESVGVFVQQTNRGAGAPIIRGLIGPSNLILVDGIRFNTATFRTGPNQYLATLDPLSASRIEILRGPSSVLYGSGAMGGVLHIITADPPAEDGLTAAAQLHGQTADLATGGAAGLSARSGDTAAAAAGSLNRFERLRPGGGGRQALSDYTSGSWQAKLTMPVTRDWNARLAYFGMLLRDPGRTDRLGQGDVRVYDNTDHLAYARLSYTGRATLRRVELTVAYHQLEEEVRRSSCQTIDGVVGSLTRCGELHRDTITRLRITRDRTQVIGGIAETELDFLDRRLNIVAGMEVYQDFVASSAQGQSRGNFSDGSVYRSLGLFAHGRGRIVQTDFGDLELSAGARISNFAASAPDVPHLGDATYDFTGAVGSGGLLFGDSERFNVYATFAQGFRAPNLQESTVLGDTGSKFEIPNPLLKPERSNTVEVGAKAAWEDLRGELTLFWSQLDDVIDERPASFEGSDTIEGKPVIRRVNADEGVYIGAEATAAVKLWRLTLGADIAWTRGEITTAGVTTPARRVPPLFGHAHLRYDHPDGGPWVAAVLAWADRQDRLHPSDLEDLRICESAPHSGRLLEVCSGTPGWVTFGIRGGLTLGKHFDVTVSLENLTDSAYRRHGSGFDAPGFDVRATLRARL